MLFKTLLSLLSAKCVSFANREWDGMVRELLEQRADVAIGDLTITFDREQVINICKQNSH